MKRRVEIILLLALPIIIVGMIIGNAGLMSRIYMDENGLNPESKICRARILPDKYDITIKTGDKAKLNMELLNQGSFIWLANGSNAVHLSYHVLDRSKKILDYDNERFILPHDMRPDDSAKIDVELDLQLAEGEYILEFDLVEEGLTWFAEKGSPTTLVKLHIN